MSIVDVKAEAQYTNLINNSTGKVIIVHFCADWAPQCNHIKETFKDLLKLGSEHIIYANFRAEDFPQIAEKHGVECVPTVIFFQDGTAVDRIDGVDVAALSAKCKHFSSITSTPKGSLEDRLKALINKAPLMLFMKGDRHAPRCGFSKQMIAILNETRLPYGTFDILSDEEIRQGLKTYSDWPTYPQLYVKGELIGGLDIIKELKANNELESTLKQ